MANVIATNDVWQLRIGTYSPIQAGINVCHLEITATTGASITDEEAALALDNALHGFYKAALSVEATYYGVSMQRIKPAPKTVPAISKANTGVGSVAGDMLPQQVSGIISWRAALSGRKYRGRIYVPFPGEAANEMGATPTAAYIASLGNIGSQLLGDTLVGAGGTATYRLVIYHTATGTTDPVATALFSDKWATQRRRGNFGRINAPPF